jgi:hypothetical protein
VRVLALLLLAAAASAQEYERARAVCDEARALRRAKGFAAAIDFLETRLDHPRVLHAYADCCLWGGEEERGLLGIGRASVGEADRLAAEVRLLVALYRYPEAAERARRLAATGPREHAEWARGEIAFAESAAALRERLSARATRAAWAAAMGVAALLVAWALLRRTPAPASARASA